MKTFVKCAFAAAFLTVTIGAQTQLVQPDASGFVPDSLSVPGPPAPKLTIIETATSWNLQVIHGVPSHYVALVVGERVGASSLDLGTFGHMDLMVTQPEIVAFVGPTSASGYLSFDIAKPGLVAPALEGMTLELQCVGIDYTVAPDPNGKAPIYTMHYVPSTVAALTIHAVIDTLLQVLDTDF